MEHQKYCLWSAVLSGAGVLFAGYLTIVKLATDTCPFNEPCPYFLGYPACWYGLALFIILLTLSLLGWRREENSLPMARGIRLVSGIGILFAGSFVVREIILALRFGWPEYTLLLPTCAYGLLVYATLFGFSHRRLLS